MKAKAEKKTANNVEKREPVIFPTLILRCLDAIVTNPESDFDPSFDVRNWVDQFEPKRYIYWRKKQ